MASLDLDAAQAGQLLPLIEARMEVLTASAGRFMYFAKRPALVDADGFGRLFSPRDDTQPTLADRIESDASSWLALVPVLEACRATIGLSPALLTRAEFERDAHWAEVATADKESGRFVDDGFQ